MSRRSSLTTALSSTPTTFLTSATTPASSSTILGAPPAQELSTLPALEEEMAQRGDPGHSVNNVFFRGESDWITYHTVVSTSADQIAIAPGYLQRQWQADGRNFFEYSMGSTHILDFFAYLSGRYQTRKEIYHGPGGDVSLELYYDPAHTYDVDDMTASSRAGLDYYERIYSPFQFTQFRILEFPLATALSLSPFPIPFPYSEAIRLHRPNQETH